MRPLSFLCFGQPNLIRQHLSELTMTDNIDGLVNLTHLEEALK